MKPKYTPGPWSIHKCGNGVTPFEVKGEDGQNWLAMMRHIGAGEKLIGEISMMTTTEDMGYPRVDNPEECIANANLAAAAPELLEALVRITDQLERVGDSRKDAPFIEEAREAIHKALGFVGVEEPTPKYDCPIHGKAASADGICGRC